jgi:hypothetical protein
MPPSSQDPPAELFATYLEIYDDSQPEHRRRRQWVILPQLPARLAPGDSPVTNHLVWFEREQRSSKHRAVWNFHEDTSGLLKRNLEDIVAMRATDGWKVSPMITCEIHPTELGQILKDRKTPYRILSRLQKVARSMHRLDIS